MRAINNNLRYRFRRHAATVCVCLLMLTAVPAMAVSPGESAGVFVLRNAAAGGYLGFVDGRVTIQADQDAGALWEIQYDHVGKSGEYVRLRPLTRADVFVHLRGDEVVVGPVGEGWLSAAWGVTGAGSEPWRLLTNRETAQSLYAQGGTLLVGDIKPGARQGMWDLDRYEGPLPETEPAPQAAPPGIAVVKVPSPSPSPATPPLPPAPGTASALATAPRVLFYVQNFSDETLGLYIEVDGTPEPVLELPPRSEARQESPVGAMWYMASGNEWVSAREITEEFDQLWRYPPRN